MSGPDLDPTAQDAAPQEQGALWMSAPLTRDEFYKALRELRALAREPVLQAGLGAVVKGGYPPLANVLLSAPVNGSTAPLDAMVDNILYALQRAHETISRLHEGPQVDAVAPEPPPGVRARLEVACSRADDLVARLESVVNEVGRL
jgi:hypothetical protein